MGYQRKKTRKKGKPIAVLGDVIKEDEKEKDSGIRTIKTQLRAILRPEYRDLLIAAIPDRSIMATKICALASQLFLFRCERAFDDNDKGFFEQNGEKVIRSCFFGVLKKNIYKKKKMPPEFRKMVHQLDDSHRVVWPNADYFGNAMNDLIDTYITNVKNNLKTHSKKRLREWLRVKVFESSLVARYEQADIDRVISLAIFGNDDITINGMDDVAKRERRTLLIGMVTKNSWWDIPDNNIGLFTNGKDWFKSIAFWISLQRKIDDFNTCEEYREERRCQREEFEELKRCRRRNHRPCTWQQPTDRGQNGNEYIEKGPPRVKNLAVIPICSFTRTHYTLDNRTLYSLLRQLGIVPLNITEDEFRKQKEYYWGQYFDMRKIYHLGRSRKKFRFRILSNGQAVSLQFDIDKTKLKPVDKKAIVQNYKKFVNEGATDPGVNTWNATTVHNIETGKEANYTISSKQYHYWTKQTVRNRQGKRWTKDFVKVERQDRENRALYPVMPSPLGRHWQNYIRHRLKMTERGIAVYTTDKYTRLNFDKYVRANSVTDSIAGMLTNHQPTLMHFGAAQMSPSSPIGIKKSLRCPGNRKMIRSYKKCRGCVSNMVDEYYTSQTCAKCFGRFDRRTKRHRFKVCHDCRPKLVEAMLPSMIVCKVNKRKMRHEKLKLFLLEKEAEEGNGNPAVGNDVPHPDQLNPELLPKVAIYHKTWHVNESSKIVEYVKFNSAGEMGVVEPRVHKTTWHRDIAAAKCILIKGHYDLFGYTLPETLQRPSNQRAAVNN
ncbi:uncharacterized protein LOC129570029 [Sitodiplosis mosellana]|uniref:uncharacterized protein LOC129570029 n=1 Tax=Sitodiplosis mosellana TaxID=263140 RepID=UPI0024440337|nr:uncharacterized protein LOC129570029 [Sitodiplosis mosellana]XP_055305361.1 uncharacterized protein LOC129570029 [Sitodiplosis mosellana]XP_055305362.1 uncharacterized protein LOC129570029 [Sitodiplosis mosellana]XP_055305364.1 uncharacterized protein LOC129570029 [Sitodiplosis mosellana]XP_055305365.1 uncharacterized protein LOC129570029 [Sitodiplosis mosellana]XP_055305366.1 uncharacterized protein LOC129570029 [Sitodiplosis mosellana]XP_055305367.1 uncharacterized protein LOC129570029 [